MENALLSVSDFVALTNQTLEYAYPVVNVEGEVSEYKLIQGKWINFKLKDDQAVVNCFAGAFQLRMPIEDGMKVVVTAAPRLNAKGYFNLNVRAVKPVGEGAIKKGFELLKAKLEAEGLFAPERKRLLPAVPKFVGVITSTESAAYADFCKIINERWGGLRVEVAHTQVQGDPAPDQMIRALRYFNSLEAVPEVVVIIRGGGSAEDLSAFNDEPLARAIAESRVPTLVGVGHEIDHTLADMVADVRAATPTNAAQLLVPDRREVIRAVRHQAGSLASYAVRAADQTIEEVRSRIKTLFTRMEEKHESASQTLRLLRAAVSQVDPDAVLRRGYALVRGSQAVGGELEVELAQKVLITEVKHVRKK